jgi:hypothetical protein
MRFHPLLFASLPVLACTSIETDPPPPPPPAPSPLARCADRDVPITTAWQVNNLHAPLVAVTRAGLTVAVASADGAVKTWILPAAGGAPAVGTPRYGTPFVDEGEVVPALAAARGAIAGLDGRGRAHLWNEEGEVMRAPAPLVPGAGVFVAIDEDRRWLAGGTAAFAGELAVTDLASGATTGPLATALWGATAAAIGHGGAWVTVGDWYGCHGIELRDPRDPAAATAYWDACHDPDEPPRHGSFRAVALDPDATAALAAGDGLLARFDLAALETGPVEAFATDDRLDHVAWLAGDGLALTLGPGDEGTSTLAVWSVEPLAPLRSVAVPEAIGLAVDAEAGVVILAGGDGLLRGLACRD